MIICLLKEIADFKMKHTLREGNQIADWIANEGTRNTLQEEIWTLDFPNRVLELCKQDLYHTFESRKMYTA